ncbi:Nuclear transcription factor Y subunit B-3, partial [Mucuna pruriens]
MIIISDIIKIRESNSYLPNKPFPAGAAATSRRPPYPTLPLSRISFQQLFNLTQNRRVSWFRFSIPLPFRVEFEIPKKTALSTEFQILNRFFIEQCFNFMLNHQVKPIRATTDFAIHFVFHSASIFRPLNLAVRRWRTQTATPAVHNASKSSKMSPQELDWFLPNHEECFITGKASDKCQREMRKTINGHNLLWAMTIALFLGFHLSG